jgi:hypothetical protein
MTVVLSIAFALMSAGAGYWVARRRRRREANDVLRRVFRRREYRELDGHLERIAVAELRRLEVTARRYVAGEVGYVVMVSDSRHGIGLGLSDGHRLELGGVNRSILRLLAQGAVEERLRPSRVERVGFAYRLLLRGETGAEMAIFARRVTLAL